VKQSFKLALLQLLFWPLLSGCGGSSFGGAKPPELGLQAWTFRNTDLCQTLVKAHAVGIHYLEAYPGQNLGGGLTGKFGYQMDEATRQALLQKAKESDVTIVSCGVYNLNTEAEWTQLFDFAKSMHLRWINCEAPQEMLPVLDRLSKSTGVLVTLHNHPTPSRYSNPDVALQAVAPYVGDIGLCADTGHWVRSGYDPVETLRKARGKIITLHLKDLNQRRRAGYDVPWGTGVSDLAGQLLELRKQGFSGIVLMEYEHMTPQLDDEVARSATFFRQIMSVQREDQLAAARVPPGFTNDPEQLWRDTKPSTPETRWPEPVPLLQPDLSNAEFKPGSWVMENGILSAKGGGDLWTRESYGDYVLSLEFRCQEKTNSGVFLRCSDTVNWLHNAIEVQILQGGDPDSKHVCGAIFDCLAPTRELPVNPGEWHRYVIIAKGNTIIVSMDGEKIINMNLDQWTEVHKNPDGTPNKFNKAYKDMAREGRIGLQYHGSPIEFRNLRIEKL